MSIFSPDYPHRFQPFGIAHIVTMLMVGAVWIVVPLMFRKGVSEKTDKRFRDTMAAILVGQYLAWMIWEAIVGRFTIALSLPINLCDLTNFLLAGLLITRSERLFEVLYFWAVAGTLQSYITPNITFAFPHFEFFMFYLQHGGEILVIVYFVFVLKFRPKAVSIIKAYGWLLVLIIGVYAFNLIADSNYMFLMADTPNPSTVTKMIALFGDPPRHMLGLSMVAFASILILYAPWWVVDLRKKKNGV